MPARRSTHRERNISMVRRESRAAFVARLPGSARTTHQPKSPRVTHTSDRTVLATMPITKEALFAAPAKIELTEPAEQDPHYVRSVTEVGERQEVVAHEDIYAANGMKLLAKGARIDRSKLERLTAHKLKTPLDLLLTAADAVNAISLANDLDKVIAADPALMHIRLRSGDPTSLKFALGRIPLPQPLAFRLTVMREDRHALYLHSLRTAAISHFLGVQLRLPQQQAEHLLLAALLHDVGEMHTDPALLVPGRKIEPEEWRHLHVHPITGFVVLQQLKIVAGEVMQAVLQHHERLDGSGYPHGHTDEKIGHLARILGMAEMHDTVVSQLGIGRLDVILRLNRFRLDARVVEALRDLAQGDLGVEERDPEALDAALRAARLSDVFHAWAALRAIIENNAVNAPLHFMIERMSDLRCIALQAGIDAKLLAALDLENDDVSVVNELNETLEEINRMLEDLVVEIRRRTETAAECHPIVSRIVDALALRVA